MNADFQLVIGSPKTCVPSASLLGNPSGFTTDTTFAWTSDNESIKFDDPTLQSPAISAVNPVDDATPSTVTFTATEPGFPPVTKSHTVSAIAVPTASFDAVDFTIQ